MGNWLDKVHLIGWWSTSIYNVYTAEIAAALLVE